KGEKGNEKGKGFPSLPCLGDTY
ncbi:hypothetical protein KIPB_014746, partial [Kipferlia bialata]